ncbi:hypothetical protein N7497_000885 [Penicillium chrysogenum]|nr:hypothetical protein N7497_000885 [Penicillium chrysogenum]
MGPEDVVKCSVSQASPQSTSDSDIGSTNYGTEDFDRDKALRATGFIGKNTGIGGLQALHHTSQGKRRNLADSTGICDQNWDGNKKPLPGVERTLKRTHDYFYELLSGRDARRVVSCNGLTRKTTIAPSAASPHRYFPVTDEMSFLRKFWSAYDVTSDPAPA